MKKIGSVQLFFSWTRVLEFKMRDFEHFEIWNEYVCACYNCIYIQCLYTLLNVVQLRNVYPTFKLDKGWQTMSKPNFFSF